MPDLFWEFIFKDATALKDTLTALGIVVGGWWTYTRFIRGRLDETALDIDLTYSTVDYKADDRLTFLNVIIKNQGKVKLRARERINPAYDHRSTDGIEHVYRFGLGVKIRKIPSDLSSNCWLDWYGDPELESALQEINLLKGYVKGEHQTDFWMEPGESYTLAAPVILADGSYLAMVTFIGASKKDDEFWQRIFLIQVPSTNCAVAQGSNPQVVAQLRR